MASVILALAVFSGGLQAARIAAARGYIQGMGVGLSFFLVTLALGWTASPSFWRPLAKSWDYVCWPGPWGVWPGWLGGRLVPVDYKKPVK